MAKTKWARALHVSGVMDNRSGNTGEVLSEVFLNELTKTHSVLVMQDATSGAFAIEITEISSGKVYAGAYNNSFYFEERVCNKESSFYAFMALTALAYELAIGEGENFSSKINKMLTDLEDGSNKVVPWKPLSFVSPIPFLADLQPVYCAVSGTITTDYVVKSKKFVCDKVASTSNFVPAFDTTDWTIRTAESYNDFEKERVVNNSLVEGYVPTGMDKLFVQRVKNSIDNKGIAPSFFLYGPAGTGKSEKGKYISKMTGLPYTFICCSAMTNESDLRGKPNKLSTTGAIVKFCKRLVKNFWNRDIDTSGIDDDTIQYSLTELVLACKYGWIIEIQEPSLIINAGTLGFLNCVLDTNRTLILPNGQQIPLHPNTTFIFTTNVDYEGCNPFNLALLSRIGYVKKIDAPSEREQVDRVISVTGYKGPREDVEKIVQCVFELQNIIADNDITQGICDIRGAIECINDYQYNGGSLRQSASLTLEDKASLEPGYEEDIKLKLDSILGEF